MQITYKKKRLEEIRYLEDYKKLPKHILQAYQMVCTALESSDNLEDVYQTYNYSSSKKNGKLADIRTIKLNDGYRLFFKLLKDGRISIIHITDVNNHDYKKEQ